MSQRWWDDPATSRSAPRQGPTPTFGRSPQQSRQFSAWGVSFVAYVIQIAVATAILFVVLLAGLLLAPFLGLAGADPSEGAVLFVLIGAVVGVRFYSLLLQARYIRRRGGRQALLACVTAFVAVAVAGPLLVLLGLPSGLVFVAGAVAEISLVAIMIGPLTPR
jgi:hypothetical protein